MNKRVLGSYSTSSRQKIPKTVKDHPVMHKFYFTSLQWHHTQLDLPLFPLPAMLSTEKLLQHQNSADGANEET